jgi:hypothetical protein
MGEGGTERAEDCTFFYGQGNGDHQLETGFFVHKRIVTAVRREELIGNRVSYIILSARWCNIIFLNVHASCEDKGDDVKYSFYEELGWAFDRLPRYYMNISLGDLNANVNRENIFKTSNRKRQFT